jgi:hypothetical protein
MSVRGQSISILRFALTALLVAAISDACALSAVAKGAAQKESPRFKKVGRTVQQLLAAPVYTAADEKLLNGAGDSAAVAITSLVSEPEMNSPDMEGEF